MLCKVTKIDSTKRMKLISTIKRSSMLNKTLVNTKQTYCADIKYLPIPISYHIVKPKES